MDRGAWWAAVHGVSKSWTRLKRLSAHMRAYARLCWSLFLQIQKNPYLLVLQVRCWCQWRLLWRGHLFTQQTWPLKGPRDKDFVSLIQEVSHCGVCMEIRKASSRYHRLFTLSLIFEWIVSVYFTTSGVSFLPSSGSPIFLSFATLFTLWAAVHGVAKSRTRLSDFTHFSLPCIGEGNGNPLHCSCLENPRDGGAWRAAVYGVAQNRTRLKRLSRSTLHSLNVKSVLFQEKIVLGIVSLDVSRRSSLVFEYVVILEFQLPRKLIITL